MAEIYDSVSQLVGRTPMIRASSFARRAGILADLLVKAESFNPSGSSKDRIAVAMLDDAERKGLLNRNSVIIEPTSGNAGVSLAMIAAVRGYRIIITMPDNMSIERRNFIRAYGAEIELTPAAKGMKGAIERAEELARSLPGSFVPGQFENSSNPRAHFDTTGPEIWEQTDGKIDFFIAGIGTGGTLSGAGEYLKSKNRDIRVIGVEPASSPVLTKGFAGPHKIQGLGAGFVPKTLNTQVCDEFIAVGNEDAAEATRQFVRTEGIFVGISSGAALHAAKVLAARTENLGKTIVALLPDCGDRYLSTSLFTD